jgi:hypothetical protein
MEKKMHYNGLINIDNITKSMLRQTGKTDQNYIIQNCISVMQLKNT